MRFSVFSLRHCYLMFNFMVRTAGQVLIVNSYLSSSSLIYLIILLQPLPQQLRNQKPQPDQQESNPKTHQERPLQDRLLNTRRGPQTLVNMWTLEPIQGTMALSVGMPTIRSIIVMTLDIKPKILISIVILRLQKMILFYDRTKSYQRQYQMCRQFRELPHICSKRSILNALIENKVPLFSFKFFQIHCDTRYGSSSNLFTFVSCLLATLYHASNFIIFFLVILFSSIIFHINFFIGCYLYRVYKYLIIHHKLYYCNGYRTILLVCCNSNVLLIIS